MPLQHMKAGRFLTLELGSQGCFDTQDLTFEGGYMEVFPEKRSHEVINAAL